MQNVNYIKLLEEYLNNCNTEEIDEIYDTICEKILEYIGQKQLTSI